MALTTVKSDQIQTSVALAGSPTTTTQSASDNSTKIATTAYADTAVANLVASAPSALNTLDELAAALNDDASFSTTVTNSIATKLPLAGGTMTGTLAMDAAIDIKSGSAIHGTITTSSSSLTLNARNTGHLIFQSGGSEKMRLANGGNVGIGDDNPSEKFVVKGDGARMIVSSADMEVAMLGRAGSSGAALDKGYLRLRNQGVTADGAVISAGGDSWLNAGNVGIGTDTPGYKLEVNGTAHVVNTLTAGAIGIPSQGITLNQAFGSGVPTMTMLGTSGNGRAGAIHFTEQGDVSTAAIYSTDGAGGNANYGGLLIAAYQSDIRFSTGGLSSTRMIIKSDGKVGIGTDSPSVPLHIQTNDGTTNTAVNSLTITNLSTGTTTTGFGGEIRFQAERNNGVNQNTGGIRSIAEINSGSNISSGMAFDTSTAGVNSEKLRISYDGNVTKPLNPSFQARYPAVTNGGNTTIVFSGTHHNIGTHYNTSNGIFTAPVAGSYLFTFAILMNPSGLGHYARIAFAKNGTSADHTYGDTLENSEYQTTIQDYQSLSMTAVIYMSANDTMRLQNTGQSPTYGTSYGSFSGYLLG